MITIDSTPEFASSVYERMDRTLAAVRKHRNRPMGLADKVLLSHLDDPSTTDLERGKSYILLRPDRVILQDVLGQTAMLQFMQTRRTRTAVPTTQHCDHLIQARVEGASDLRESLAENQEVYNFLRTAAAKYGVGFWEPGAGIIHQVALEEYAFPGEMIIGTDSHTPMAGGLGSCAVGVGGADAVEVMAGLPWELLYPKFIGVYLTGELNGWTAPKDVILRLAGELTVSGGTNAIIEYFGPGTRSISATGKATITNMGAELGATTSIFPYDRAHGEVSGGHAPGRAGRCWRASTSISSPRTKRWRRIRTSIFDRVVRIDLSTLEPHIVGPHSPDRARPISQLAAEVQNPSNQFVDEISSALIGSCTNSSYEDMSRSADVAEQARAHGVEAAVPFMVTPGSEQVRATIERDGQMASLKAIGGTVLANACGPCIGQWRPLARDESTKPNTIVTSYNRNFPMRNDGQPTTMNFIGSPEIVTAMALAGKLSFNPLTDTLTGARWQALQAGASQTSPGGAGRTTSIRVTSAYVAPPEDGSSIELAVSPTSERHPADGAVARLGR